MGFFVIVGTQFGPADTYVHKVTPQGDAVNKGRPHDTPGKGELAVTPERVQISRG